MLAKHYYCCGHFCFESVAFVDKSFVFFYVLNTRLTSHNINIWPVHVNKNALKELRNDEQNDDKHFANANRKSKAPFYVLVLVVLPGIKP
jgi:hypothetical protein